MREVCLRLTDSLEWIKRSNATYEKDGLSKMNRFTRMNQTFLLYMKHLIPSAQTLQVAI